MDLNDILNKTKKRSEQIKVVHKPPSIASTDRPYSEDDLPKGTANFISNTENTSLETDNKPATKWQQIVNKLTTETSFSELVGLQREIIIFICH